MEKKVKAWNMDNNRGKAIANQIIIEIDGYHRYFQSYGTMIARIDVKTHKIALDTRYWDYSSTTSKYRNSFLGLTSAETKAMIKSGEITLTNLN